MQRYKAKIRLGGSVLNEVPKEAMMAPEVLVMRAMHGEDAVVDLAAVDSVEMSNAAVWDYLLAHYGRARILVGNDQLPLLTTLFGAPRVSPLPTKLDGFEEPAPAKGGKSADLKELSK